MLIIPEYTLHGKKLLLVTLKHMARILEHFNIHLFSVINAESHYR